MAFTYRTPVSRAPEWIASIAGGRLRGPSSPEGGRMIIRGGRVVDPANGLDAVRDVALADGRVAEVAESITPGPGGRVVDAAGLVVAPRLIEVHVHLHDLFEVTTRPILERSEEHTSELQSPCNLVCR